MGTAEQFKQALFQLHGRIQQQTGYNALGLLRLIASTGGVGAAKRLLATPEASRGFVELACQGRADLTLEYLVLDTRWRALFEEREREVARKKLQKAGYAVSKTGVLVKTGRTPESWEFLE